jgi:hypothetical protein
MLLTPLSRLRSLPLPVRFFEESGYFSFMICENGTLVSSRPQTSLYPPYNVIMGLLRLPALRCGLLQRDVDTLDGRILAVPLK